MYVCMFPMLYFPWFSAQGLKIDPAMNIIRFRFYLNHPLYARLLGFDPTCGECFLSGL